MDGKHIAREAREAICNRKVNPPINRNIGKVDSILVFLTAGHYLFSAQPTLQLDTASNCFRLGNLEN